MGWCFQLMYSTGPMTWTRSLELCTEAKTTLSGAMTASEVSWFLSAASQIRKYTPKQDIVVRVSGVRTFICESIPASASCKTANGFTFTDKNIDSIDKYSWMTNPGAQATSDSNCLVLVVKGTNAIKADVQRLLIRTISNNSHFFQLLNFHNAPSIRCNVWPAGMGLVTRSKGARYILTSQTTSEKPTSLFFLQTKSPKFQFLTCPQCFCIFYSS